MKISVFRFTTTSATFGGAEQSALLHAQLLSMLGHSARLYSNINQSFPGMRRVIMPRVKLVRWLYACVTIPFIATLKRSDLLNPHSREDQITLTLTKWLHRTPVVWKDPGDLVHQIRLERSGFFGRINQKLLIAAIKRADAIYTLNRHERSDLLEKLGELNANIDEDKIKVIPSDILFSDYELNARPPKDTDKIVIGTLSRLDEHKGIQYLIEAAKNLTSRHNNLEFWVVGDGTYRSELEELGNGLGITFWGHQADISPFLSRMDIFVQPAEFEGWGRNVKEARYFGKAIVGSNTGGIALQIEDDKTGLLFEPKNVDELEAKLEKLIKDKKLRDKLGQAAKKSALAEGDFRSLIKNQIFPLFESVLRRKQ